MRRIKKVAVLGSGVMGSAIACHFANIGLEVLMLDILPLNVDAKTLKTPAERNQVAATALGAALKQKPAPLYKKEFAERITVGNFEDDFAGIGDCDWVLEAVVERLEIKQQVLANVDTHRKSGTLVSSNTSGIPIHLMLEGRSEDFCAHFLGTHFFNPPRYLPLLEIIPSPKTDREVIDFLMDYGDRYLGKTTVLCKDTPAFIANRVGVYAMLLIFHLAENSSLSISDIDKLTGPAIGRPNTGTFRLADLVGLDVADHVTKGIQQNCPDDAMAQALHTPKFLQYLLDHQWFGNKSGKGFYQKTAEKDDKGRSIILSLNLETLEYERAPRSSLPSLTISKQIDDLTKRLPALLSAGDAGSDLLKHSFAGLFAYVSQRIREISDTLYAVDDALRAGFGWQIGPFEYWDILGVEQGIQMAEAEGYVVAQWVHGMLQNGKSHFYIHEGHQKKYYDLTSGDYHIIPGSDAIVRLSNYRNQKPVFTNNEVILHDIGDQVLCFEFTSKSNAIGEGILRGFQEAFDIAEGGDWRGMVIGNEAKNFSVGANLMLIAMLVYDEQWDDLEMAVRLFQQTAMRCRYSAIPVVAATQGYVFGGSCEVMMHCDAVCAAAESYIGQVEVGVGLLPGGGGTKEFALRASDQFFDGDVMIPTLIEKFKTLAMGLVSTSAHEAFDHGYLLSRKDKVIINGSRNLDEAKAEVLRLSETYTAAQERDDIFVLGREGLGALYTAANELYRGHYASEHDIKIARKIAWVLCGGDLSATQKVTEQYLLDVEREAFLSLLGEQKTIERMQYMLENGKPLRN